MELEQKSLEDSKNRILTEFSAEKDRLLKEIHQKEQELEMQREKFHKDKKEITEQMNREFTEKMRMIEKRNQVLKQQTKTTTTTYSNSIILLAHKNTLNYDFYSVEIRYICFDIKKKLRNKKDSVFVLFSANLNR